MTSQASESLGSEEIDEMVSLCDIALSTRGRIIPPQIFSEDSALCTKRYVSISNVRINHRYLPDGREWLEVTIVRPGFPFLIFKYDLIKKDVLSAHIERTKQCVEFLRLELLLERLGATQ